MIKTGMMASKATLGVIRENVKLKIGLIVLAISLILCIGFIFITSSVHKTPKQEGQIPVLAFTSSSSSVVAWNVTFSVTNPNQKLSLVINNLAVSPASDRLTVGGDIISADGLPVTVFEGNTKVLAPILLSFQPGGGNQTLPGFGGAIQFSLQTHSTIMHFHSPLGVRGDIPTNLQLIPVSI